MMQRSSLHTSLVLLVAVGVTVIALLPITIDTVAELSPEIKTAGIEPTSPGDLPTLATSTISFTGDVMLGRHVEYLARQYGTDYSIRQIADMFASSTHLVINFESAMATPHQKTPNGGMRFSTDEVLLGSLVRLGVTHASLANNHSFDFGQTGYEQARERLVANGIVPFGNARYVSSSSITRIVTPTTPITLLGVHTLYREPTALELQDILATIPADDLVVVYVHWGDEYVLVPNSRQRAFAKTLVLLGADLVIGHHPHVVQTIELVDGVPVVYSLGNFIFDQYFSSAVQTGLVVDLVITPTNRELVLRGITRHDRAQPRPMTNEESAAFFTSIANRSDVRIRDEIRAQSIRF